VLDKEADSISETNEPRI